MKQRVEILIFTLIATFGLKAQIAQNNNATLNDLSFFININNQKYSNTEGSKYINEEFIPSKINNGDKLYFVRFDVVDNIMEFKENNQEIKGISPSRDYKIVLSDGSNRVYVSKTIINESGELKRLFLEEIQSNEAYSLYKKQRIKFQAAKPAKSSYEPEIPAVFKKMNDVFYVDYPKDSIDYLIQVPKSRKKAKTFFGNHSSTIIKYAKKEGLKFNSPESLIKIFDYYIQIQ